MALPVSAVKFPSDPNIGIEKGQGTKRQREKDGPEEERAVPASKRREIESTNQDEVQFRQMKEIALLIRAGILPSNEKDKFFDLPPIRVSFKGWKELLKVARLDFDWSICKTEADPDRFRFFIGFHTLAYIQAREKELSKKSPATPQLETLYPKFEEAMVRCPPFGAFVWEDLTHQCPTVRQIAPHLHQETFERYLRERPRPATEAGDLLLEGLLELEPAMKCQDPLKMGLVFEKFQKAIQKGATSTSYLALKFFKPPTYTFFNQLAVMSIGKNNDFRGLEELIYKYDLTSKLKEWMCYPPILTLKALLERDLSEKEKWFDRAFQAYPKEDVPVPLLVNAGLLQLHLKNYTKADTFFTPLAGFEKLLSKKTYWNIAIVKHQLKKYEEAEHFYKKALKDYGKVAPKELWLDMIRLKLEIAKPSEAIVYFEEFLDTCGDQVPPEVDIPPEMWVQVAKKQQELGNNRRATQYIDHAMALYSDKAPLEAVIAAAGVYDSSGDYKKARECYQKAIEGVGERVPPPSLWAIAARVEYHLNHHLADPDILRKALEFSEKAIQSYGTDVPGNLWETAVKIRFDAQKYQEAKLVCQKAMAALGDQVTPELLHEAAIVSFQLQEYGEAEMLCQKAMAGYPDQIPTQVLTTQAQIQYALKKYPEAAKLALTALGKAPPSHT